MSELQSAANAAVPESVNGRKNNPVGNPVKRDVLTWTAKRGRISVKNSNGRLAFRTDVRGRARIKGRIDLFLTQIPFSVHANLGAVLNASMRPRLRANWTFNPNVKANARVTYAEIPIEHIGSISIRSEVQPVLNRELADALRQLRKTLDNPNLLKHQLRPVWSQICTVIPVEGDVPNLWFVIKPQRLLASQLQVNNQGVKLALGLETQTSLLAQPRRPPQPHCPLPARLDLRSMPPDGEMSVSVPTIVQWDFLESELERVLSNPVALPAVGRLRLSNISVEPDGRRISIGADVATDHFRRRIWIGARPILRPSMKKIFFRELTLSLGGTSSLENNLAANGGALLGLLAPLATVDYSSEENRLIGRAQRMLDSLSSQLTSRATVTATVRRIWLSDIKVGTEGLLLVAGASGSLRVDNIRMTANAF